MKNFDVSAKNGVYASNLHPHSHCTINRILGALLMNLLHTCVKVTESIV